MNDEIQGQQYGKSCVLFGAVEKRERREAAGGTLAVCRISLLAPHRISTLHNQMFFTLREYFKAPFRSSNPVTTDSDCSEVDRQIRSELAVATETGMVSTRSQEPGLIVDFEELSAKGTPKLRSTKRKSESESHTDTDDSRCLKRRKATPKDTPASRVRISKPVIAASVLFLELQAIFGKSFTRGKFTRGWKY